MAKLNPQEAARTKEQLMELPNVQQIMSEQGPTHRKHYRLHIIGLSPTEIRSLTGSLKTNIQRDIGGYTRYKKPNGQFVYQLPYEQ